MIRCSLLIFMSALFTPYAVFADGFDYQLGGSARSYPVGARASVLLGYSKTLWSAEKSPLAQNQTQADESTEATQQTPWKFGYIRPVVSAESSFFVNRGIAEIEIFPISILGFATGSSVSSRGGYDFAGFDCDRSQCDGTLRKTHVRGQMILAAGSFNLVLKHRVDWFRSNHQDKVFVEELSALEGLPGQDELRSWTGILGYSLAPKWTTGFAYDTQRFSGSRSQNEGLYLFLSGGHKDFQAVIGLGGFKSTHQGLEPSLFVDFRWIGKKGPGLLD